MWGICATTFVAAMQAEQATWKAINALPDGEREAAIERRRELAKWATEERRHRELVEAAKPRLGPGALLLGFIGGLIAG